MDNFFLINLILENSIIIFYATDTFMRLFSFVKLIIIFIVYPLALLVIAYILYEYIIMSILNVTPPYFKRSLFNIFYSRDNFFNVALYSNVLPICAIINMIFTMWFNLGTEITTLILRFTFSILFVLAFICYESKIPQLFKLQVVAIDTIENLINVMKEKRVESLTDEEIELLEDCLSNISALIYLWVNIKAPLEMDLPDLDNLFHRSIELYTILDDTNRKGLLDRFEALRKFFEKNPEDQEIRDLYAIIVDIDFFITEKEEELGLLRPKREKKVSAPLYKNILLNVITAVITTFIINWLSQIMELFSQASLYIIFSFIAILYLAVAIAFIVYRFVNITYEIIIA